MAKLNKQIAIFYFLFTMMALAIVFLVLSCEDESTEPSPEIDLTPFKELARAADCTDIRNRLYLIDSQLVFWDRAGDCPDNSYAQKLFGSKIDTILCDSHDSIAGPVIIYQDDLYRGMFDTIIANLDQPDLGLGPDHTVQTIPF
jgi:hypothetical protein